MGGMDTELFQVKRDRLLLAEVERGELSIKVSGPGILAPREVRWISSNVEGLVERVLVKPGAVVRAGDLLVELSNPQLQQTLEETRWELESREAQAQADSMQAESTLLDQQALVLDAKLNHQSAEMRLKAETQLIAAGMGALSQLDFERSKLEATQLEERWIISLAQLEKAKQSAEAQQNARLAGLKKMRKTLQRIELQVLSLQVNAQIDSVVQEVAIEAGQRVVLGGNIARLAQQDNLIAELKIPELQIRDVTLGQSVIIDTRNSTIDGRVTRIAPNVLNGTVQVDVELLGALPSDARPDLTIDGEILVADIVDILHVRRPTYAQSHNKTTVYRVASDGASAEKISVSFGQGSVQSIEIVEGLQHGDRIIISDTQEFQRHDSISIQ
jgi:multidrug efflux pump subunit AcrA (membrane-fusion protein)